MKTIKVYHANNRFFSKMNSSEFFDEEAKAQLIRENFSEFEKVVEFQAQDDYTLDDVFRWTNNIEEPWGLKFGIEKGMRSTSLGEVIEMWNGAKFMVARFGFIQLANF